MSPARVLIVEHESSCPPGWFGSWLAAHGCALDVCRPYRGEDLPTSTRGYGGLLVLGGAMNIYEDGSYPWLAGTRSLIRQTVKRSQPFFGICLGHQLAASALGGVVRRNPMGVTRGITAVGWTPAAATDSVFERAAQDLPVAVHWNGDVVTQLPRTSTVLAYDSEGSPQAVRFAPQAWGVQFHPEAGSTLIEPWTIQKHEAAEQARDGFDRRAAWQTVRARDGALTQTWRPVATAWARHVHAYAAQPR